MRPVSAIHSRRTSAPCATACQTSHRPERAQALTAKTTHADQSSRAESGHCWTSTACCECDAQLSAPAGDRPRSLSPDTQAPCSATRQNQLEQVYCAKSNRSELRVKPRSPSFSAKPYAFCAYLIKRTNFEERLGANVDEHVALISRQPIQRRRLRLVFEHVFAIRILLCGESRANQNHAPARAPQH